MGTCFLPAVVLVLLLQPAAPQEHDWQHSYILSHVDPYSSRGTGSAEPGYATVAKPQSAEPAFHAAPTEAASPVSLLLRHKRLPAALHEAGLRAVPARSLSVAITAGATGAVATDPVAQQLEAAVDETAGGCPSVNALLSGPGCTCTVYYPTAGTGDNSRSNHRVQVNVCPAGYRCSPTAAAAVVSAGWRFPNNASRSSKGGLTTEQGICIPCQLGEFCPRGSYEETTLSLSACELQIQPNKPASQDQARKPAAGADHSLGQASSCSGVKLCPEGSWCPSPAQRVGCEPGRWCSQGSIKSQPCNITGLLVWNPFTKAPGGSQLLLEAIVKASEPMDGNSCPVNATNPLQGCEPGFYCSTPADKLPCPVGKYCPGHTSAPVPCPVLGSCTSSKATAPDWSIVGVLLLLLVLMFLLLLLEFVRVTGRCRRKLQSQEDDVIQLIEAVGLKMVGSNGSYQVSRTANSLSEGGSHDPQQQSSGLHAQGAQVLRSSRLAFSRAFARLMGLWHKQHHGKDPASASAPVLVPVPAGKGTGDHAVLTVDGLLDAQHKPAGRFAWLRGRRDQQSHTHKGHLVAPSGSRLGKDPSMMSTPQKPPLEAVPSATRQYAALSPLTVPVKAGDAGLDSARGSSGSSSDEPCGDYSINPRLTLVFRDVWVADKPIEEGLMRKARRQVQGLCAKGYRAPSRSNSYSSSGQFDSSAHPACTKAALANMYAKLEGAAAAGAYFIVPGVSSCFAHSQLHAIMGPSGCGKTTLCKALAGRLPQSRMCGDVRVLCSSAADQFQAAVELTAAGSVGSAAAACNISHMTGFVPQFDQLHESLTVLENLLLATQLRLPISCKGHGFTAAARRHWERQRHREVHKVVGEVSALLGLTKVATTVVGSSSDRMLSGGQRKRVAIGVELVSKPSLLWLDEPTSGLDAAVAYDVVAALKASSERGMNVLAVMHQPRCSIFNMFDTCLLLGSNGHVVYSGPQRLVQHYMAFLGFYIPARENLADFLLDVTAGTVPRPGDPDYIPSQLSTMWHKAGGLWVQMQLRKEQQLQEHGGLQTADTLQLAEMLPAPTPAVDAPVDWPWRPRDLEALLSRFHLLVDSGPVGRGGFDSSVHSSVLSYDGFLTFWDESGIKELLGEEQFALFIEGLCEDFGIKQDSCITKAHFIQVLKGQLRAAAAVAAGLPDDTLLPPTPSAHGMRSHAVEGPQQTDPAPLTSSADALQHAGADSATWNIPASSPAPLARKSRFADYSQTPIDEDYDFDQLHKAQQAALQKADEALAKCDAAAKSCKDAPAAVEDAAACEAAEAAMFDAAVAACEAEQLAQAAAARCPAAAAAAAGAGAGGAGECGLPEVGPAHTPARTPVQLSRSCSNATGLSHGERVAFAPGVLTCPQARLKQHALMRMRSRRMEGVQGSGTPVRSGPSVTAEFAQRQQQCQQLQEQRQQCQQHMQALLRCRKAQREAMAAATQQAGMRQLSQVRLMQTGGSFMHARPADLPPCTSLQEARSRCLDQLGDFLVMQQQRQQQQQPGQQARQQAWPDMCTAARAATMPDALRHRSGYSSYLVQLPSIPADAESAGDTWQLPRADGTAVTPAGDSGRDASATTEAAAAAAAAAAAVSSRRLPSWAKQLQVVMLRSSWKAVQSRTALMTDILLTSVLGLALGVAQGRQIYPGSSLMWMVITLLAYGCIQLMRSTRSYGSERHIYLQQESPAGVRVSAWVFGHQLIDMVGLTLHPVLFYAWMYVLTLTPVPAWSYFITLMAVGVYTSGLGYLVSLTVNPANSMIAGLAVALLLGGVANGVVPSLWQLEASHPLLWLDYLSYTRWGLQALYISWLIPASGPQAPATATFLSGLGFCGLEPSLMQALTGRSSGWDAGASKGIIFNATTVSGQQWWNLTSSQRADALADAAAATLRDSPNEARSEAAAAAAITQLWQYYNHPRMLNDECQVAQGTAVAVLVGLGLLCRLLVFGLVKYKVARKAQE